MRVLSKLFSLLFLVIVFTTVSAPNVYAADYSLSGTVKDNAGTPLGGVTVTAKNQSGDIVGTAVTDSTLGEYSFSQIPEGNHSIQVVPPATSGFQSSTTSVSIQSNTVQNFVLVPGQPLVTITGHITAGGVPIPGIEVASNVTTDSNGFYSYTKSPGRFAIYIRTYNNTNPVLPFEFVLAVDQASMVANADTTFDVDIPVTNLTVEVQNTNGQAIEDAYISSGLPTGVNFLPVTVTTNTGTLSNIRLTRNSSSIFKNGETDQNGRLIMKHIAAGSYKISTFPPDNNYLESSASVDLHSDVTHAVVLQPKPLVTISGQITAGGVPVPGVEVASNVTTDSNGFYSFQQSPGRFAIYIRTYNNTNPVLPFEFVLAVDQASMVANTNTTFNVDIPVSNLTVNVQNSDNQPIQNASVSSGLPTGVNFLPVTVTTNTGTLSNIRLTRNSSSIFKNGETDQNGRLIIKHIAAGSYKITVTPPDNTYFESSTSVDLHSNDTLPVTLQYQQTVTISGQITAGGVPVPGIEVASNVTTDSNGFYSFTKSPGRFAIYIRTYNNTNPVLPFEFVLAVDDASMVASTNTTFNVDIPVSNLTVNVQKANGQAIEDAYISSGLPTGVNFLPVTVTTNTGTLSNIRLTRNSSSIFKNGETDQNGRLIMKHIAAGSYKITAFPPDNNYVESSTSVDLHSDVTQNYILQYSEEARLTLNGTVYVDANQNGFQDSGENGYSGAEIELNTGPTATTDSNGSYTFEDLAPGIYETTLNLPNGYTATTTNPATVALNTDTTQNFGIFSGPSLVTAINTGGNADGDFVADTNYTGGSVYTTSTAVDTSGVNTPAPESVYKSVRYGNFTYTVPNLTPNASYTFRLHFNELYWNAASARVFNVSANGQQVLSSYDIYQKAGGKNKAVIEQVPATADPGGNVLLQFSTVTDNAMVNGIEVYSGELPSPTPTATPTPVNSLAVNTGGASSGSFTADSSFTGGSVYTTTNSVATSSVTNPAPTEVYQSVRYGNFSYTMSNLNPNTNYLVRLHFNELYWNSAGQRVFNVAINGAQVLGNYDIYQAAGGANKAVIEQIVAPSDATGKITVAFSTIVDNAMVNGIELENASTLPTYTLSGTVYNDADKNGFQDTDEDGSYGVTVTLGNGQNVSTDSTGTYTFANLLVNSYTVRALLPNGYIATTQNPATLSVTANTTQNFGLAQQNYAINTGGSVNGIFLADQQYSGGSIYTTTNSVDTSGVTNPAPAVVYQSVRYGNFSYTIPNLTPNSTHTVRLHFNELYWNSAGSRVFNVSVNGSQVLNNYDIFQAAGGANKAVTEEVQGTTDANGNLVIQFATVTDNAMVNGIELLN